MPKPPATFLREQLAALEHCELRVPSPHYTGNFTDILDRWFGGSRWQANGNRFTLLATDASGGMYCLWWYPELGDKRAPVVYLGSEGDGLAVIANATVDFIEAIASGHHWRDEYIRELDNVDAAKLAAFSECARAEYQLAGREPQAIADAGRANHPDFAAWVKRHTS